MEKLPCFGETLSDFKSNPNEENAVLETIIIVERGRFNNKPIEIDAILNRRFFADKEEQMFSTPIGIVKVKHYEKNTMWTPNYAKDAEKYALEYLVEIGKAFKVNDASDNPGQGEFYLKD